MDIYDIAMRLEKEGEALYRGFARKSLEKGLAVIFIELAEEEKKHWEILRQMKEKTGGLTQEDVVYKSPKNVFRGWEILRSSMRLDMSQTDLYRLALGMEHRSIDFYTRQAQQTTDTVKKQVFERIIDEEKRHCELIENIIEFLSAPERWVENAEFSKVGEEY